MLRVFAMEQRELWDATVRSFGRHDVYHLSGYVHGFALHGDGEPLLFYYEGQALRGINVVMRRDVAQAPFFRDKLETGMWFDFSTPYGYGGWLLEGSGPVSALEEEYGAWCRENRVVSEFVRFHPMLPEQPEALKALYEVVAMGPTVAMELTDREGIWQQLTSKNRNMVRKAQKSGLTVCHAQTPESYEQFRLLYNDTMDRDRASAYYYFAPEFYGSILRELKDESLMFYVLTPEGAVAAASIMLMENGRMNYHLSGSCPEFRSLAPTNLLLYEAAVWGAENGFETLHLGGGVGSREDSLYAFKKNFFRGEPKRHHVGKRVWDPDAYARLTAMRRAEDGSFFPAYRK